MKNWIEFCFKFLIIVSIMSTVCYYGYKRVYKKGFNDGMLYIVTLDNNR